MNKRGVYLIFLAVLLLGCFFQYLRMDGFLHLGALRNFAAVERAKQQPWAEADAIARDRYLIFYDPEDVASMFARHNVERLLAQQKKDYESHPLREAVEISQETRGVIFATGRVGVAASLSAALSYAAAGGTVLFTQRLEAADDTAPLTDEARGALGLASIGGAADTPGVRFPTDFLVGVQGKAFDNGIYETQADAVTLAPDAVVDMESAAGVPLLWHHAYGAGEVIAYNGAERDDKTNRGVLAAMLAHCGEDAVYPVVGVKLFFIDDFPAPTPEGDFSKIYEETGLSTAEFYRENWWPWMQENAKHVWGWMIENDALFSRDMSQLHNLIDDAPKTNAFGDGSAPRTHAWLGWQIVKQYVKKSGVGMEALLAETDSRKILNQSGWRP